MISYKCLSQSLSKKVLFKDMLESFNLNSLGVHLFNPATSHYYSVLCNVRFYRDFREQKIFFPEIH